MLAQVRTEHPGIGAPDDWRTLIPSNDTAPFDQPTQTSQHVGNQVDVVGGLFMLEKALLRIPDAAADFGKEYAERFEAL